MKKVKIQRRIKRIPGLFLLLLFTFMLAGEDAKAGVQDFSESPKQNLIEDINFINGDFEYPNIFEQVIPGSSFDIVQAMSSKFNYIPSGVDERLGWYTVPADPANNSHSLAYHIEIHRGLHTQAYQGEQNGEINAALPGRLYQLCNTQPGQKVYYEFYHRGVDGYDIMNFYLCVPGASNGLQKECRTDNTAWKRYYGVYTVPPGQTVTEFAFEAHETSAQPQRGNMLDAIRLFNPSFLELEKNVKIPGGRSYALAGERVTYSIQISNTGEADSSRTVITDILPDGTSFVDGSVTMTYINPDGSTEEIAITDQVSYDSSADKLTIAAGKLISGEEIWDEYDNKLDNVYANGTYKIEQDAAVLVCFDVLVSGDGIAPGSIVKNQARVTYNDLGFEQYSLDAGDQPKDEHNVSEVVSFQYKKTVELDIEKSLVEAAQVPETFVFRIDYRSDETAEIRRTFYAAVQIEAGDIFSMKQMNGLHPGHYTVTEAESNWNYQPYASGNTVWSGLLDGVSTISETAVYTNERKVSNLIAGKNKVTNRLVVYLINFLFEIFCFKRIM